MLGGLEGAAAVLLAEGYATATGNLLHVVQALQALLPTALLVVCGDDDAATPARAGRNAGRAKAKAEALARAVQGLQMRVQVAYCRP